MIEPVLRDDAFLEDVNRIAPAEDEFRLWWLGQSGFLLQWQGRHLLLDPYLSDSLTRKYANTDKPHVRMTARIVDPARLDMVSLITSSHNHTDHLDRETLVPLLQGNPSRPLIIPEANRSFVLERLGGLPQNLIGLDAGKATKAAGFVITGVPAAHETIERDEQGRCRFLGYVIEFGPWTVYHSGDTVWDDAILHALARWQIDLMLLPINGRSPARRVAGNLDGREAALLAKKSGARWVIPCHYEMFEFNTASPEDFIRAAIELKQAHRVLRCGERWESGPYA